MGLLDKVKNLFTEEVEEEVAPVKNEVRHIEVEAPTRVERENNFALEEEEEEKKEDKFVFFSDDDFKDLETPVVKEKPVIEKKEVTMYRSEPKIIIEEKTTFKPSPIISPVYGILDKNYSKEEVVTKKIIIERPTNGRLSVDDVRRKAYGTIEDDFKDTLEGKNIAPEGVAEVSGIDIFEELAKYDKLDELEERTQKNDSIDVDDIFDSLDNKKDEIIEELDNKKEEILDELDNKKEDIIINEEEQLEETNTDLDEKDNSLDDLDLDEETLELSKQLENQKKRLDEINDIMPNEEETEEPSKDDIDESELFDLIDSMYDKKDDE